MSPRKVRRKYVRHLLVWGPLALLVGGLGFIWPVVWVVAAVVVGFSGGAFLVVFGLPCLVIACGYFIKTGYWVNPFRFGPWGDWKKEL